MTVRSSIKQHKQIEDLQKLLRDQSKLQFIRAQDHQQMMENACKSAADRERQSETNLEEVLSSDLLDLAALAYTSYELERCWAASAAAETAYQVGTESAGRAAQSYKTADHAFQHVQTTVSRASRDLRRRRDEKLTSVFEDIALYRRLNHGR